MLHQAFAIPTWRTPAPGSRTTRNRIAGVARSGVRSALTERDIRLISYRSYTSKMPASQGVPPRYSIVVPFHDEQDSVRELHQRLSEVMTGRYDPVEFVYVDDQSSDATPQILAAIAEEDPRVAVLRLKRNYGQTTALAAGFDFASGDIIVSMDGDLQHDPPTSHSARRPRSHSLRHRQRLAPEAVDNFMMRRLPSRIANWMMSKLPAWTSTILEPRSKSIVARLLRTFHFMARCTGLFLR